LGAISFEANPNGCCRRKLETAYGARGTTQIRAILHKRRFSGRSELFLHSGKRCCCSRSCLWVRQFLGPRVLPQGIKGPEYHASTAVARNLWRRYRSFCSASSNTQSGSARHHRRRELSANRSQKLLRNKKRQTVLCFARRSFRRKNERAHRASRDRRRSGESSVCSPRINSTAGTKRRKGDSHQGVHAGVMRESMARLETQRSKRLALLLLAARCFIFER